MALRLLSESTVLPVSIPEIKSHLRISTASTVEDALLTAMIQSAKAIGENLTKRAFVPQTYQYVLDGFPNEGLELPIAPLSTKSTNVTIYYIDEAGSTITLASTMYVVDSYSEPGFVVPSYDNIWPDTRDQINSVMIQYVTGYVVTTAVGLPDVPTTPEPIKTWIKMRVGQMYEYREPLISGALIADLKRDFVDGLLDPYRLPTA
jgi:uncharacterized phiE125 gp8 family phage protein